MNTQSAIVIGLLTIASAHSMAAPDAQVSIFAATTEGGASGIQHVFAGLPTESSFSFQGGRATAGGNPSPYLHLNADVTASATGSANVRVQGSFDYDILLTGPNQSMLVPIQFAGSYSVGAVQNVNSGGNTSISARVTAGGNSGDPGYFFSHGCSNSDGQCRSGTFQGSVSMRPGNLVHIRLGAEASANSQTSHSSSSSAFIDPYFFIDPQWQMTNPGYSLFAQGVGNAAPVPEPATCGLLAAGLALIWLNFHRAGVFRQLTSRDTSEL